MPNIATWVEKLPQLIANPGDTQTLALQQLEETLAGTADVTDPTNPVIFVMSNSAVNAAAAIMGFETYSRRLFEKLAVTPDDLYTHMSDVDYLNHFAIPSQATFNLLLAYDELMAAMVPTGVNGIKKVTIPRFTEITVNEAAFTMQYPIDIRQAASGGLQIVYNQDQTSPIQTLQTNIVPWQIVTLYETIGASKGPIQFVQIQLPLQQFKISSSLIKFNYSSGVFNRYPYDDQFYFARAYSVNSDGSTTEILTTHTDQTFDPTKPTLLLHDLGGVLEVELPQIYLTNQMVGSEIQLDIYTTKGQLTMPLSAYAPNSYGIRWNGAQPADTPYVAPLTTFETMTIYSDDTTHSGANQMDFATLRDRVMTNNFGPVQQPITPSQLSQALSNLGYQPVIDVDVVTNRIVLGTRQLPPPSNGSTTAGAAMSIETLVASFAELVGNSAVMNNGNRITLLPTMLYQLVSGQLQVVSDSALQQLNALSPDALVRAINNANYLYTPFHYVLDATNDLFALRAYYLDNPEINSIQFVMENETAGLEVGTQDKELIRTATGYRLRLQCQSSDTWKQLPDASCFCQLAFIPEGEKTYAYMNGTLITTQNNERIYEFDITTNYDVDTNDALSLTSFQMYNDSTRVHAIPMTGTFDIFWAATGVSGNGVSTTQIDLDMGTQLLPAGTLGISRERMSVELGNALNNLWHRSRTVAGSGIYQKYVADVPATYVTDVYQRDATTGQITFTVVNGNIQMTKLHSAGDPVLDANGNPTYLHRAGDPVLDANGNPVLTSPGTLKRQIDLLMVEGVYYFASQADTVTYRGSVPQTLALWVTTDLLGLSEQLLEQTELFFYPKATLGDVQILNQNGQLQTIQAPQLFAVNYYLDDAAWRNADLRAPLTQAAVQTIASALQQKTVTMQSLNATLTSVVGSDVVGFDISGLGGDTPLTTLTVTDDSTRLSIRKQAVVEADGTIGVEDGVTVSFFPHDTSTSINGIS